MLISSHMTIGNLLVAMTDLPKFSNSMRVMIKEVGKDVGEQAKKELIGNSHFNRARSRTGQLASTIIGGLEVTGDQNSQVFSSSVQAGSMGVQYARILELGGTVHITRKTRKQQTVYEYKRTYKSKKPPAEQPKNKTVIAIRPRPYLYPVCVNHSVKYVKFYLEVILNNLAHGAPPIMRGGYFDYNPVFGASYNDY